jgi:flagellar hook-associated protein 1 FlgK
MSNNNIFSSSLSGLNAAMYQMNVTQNNIANANTPGYTREVVTLSPQASSAAGGSGFVGQGVAVAGVTRMYSDYLTTQVMQQQTQSSYQSTYLSSITQVNNLLSNTTSGVPTSLTGFFAASNSLTNAPSSIPARQTVLSAAQTVVDSFQSASQTLSNITSGLTTQISSTVQQINTFAKQIASLNASISSATAVSGQQPNALIDQRDQLVSQLSQQIGVSTQLQPDGTMNVFIGSGQALVVNDRAMGLQLIQNPTNPAQVNVAYLNNGKLTGLKQSSLQGGNLGAYVAFQSNDLQNAQNQLGLVALGFASNINQQNQMGQDLNGSLGGNLINVAPPVVNATSSNTGTATVTATISNVSAMTSSDYQLNFDGANYSLMRLTDNTVTQLGTTAPINTTVDGVKITASAGMAAGDSFTIRPTANAASSIAMLTTDPAKIAAAAPMLASAAVANKGTGTISPGSVNTPLPLNANLQAPVSITFSNPPTSYTVAGAVPAVAGTVAYTPGQNITYNGWTMQISGAPAAGDVFNVASNLGGTGDNRNALLMAGLQTQNLMSNGTTSLQGVYSQLVGAVGSKTSELIVTSTAQNALLTQAVAAQQSVSGVNLDEEAANLLQYQRAYQASAKAMQIANTMFDALMTLR